MSFKTNELKLLAFDEAHSQTQLPLLASNRAAGARLTGSEL
jgi:hypothetical protein